jgi:hypothetical protein
MSITAGITAVKASLDLAKILSDRLNRPDIDIVDVRAKVHEMLIHMVNAQVALGEAHVQISDLRRELENRDEQKALDADMDFVIDGGFYVRKSEAPRGLIPYCPVCWKKDGATVPLETSMTPGWYRCSIHSTLYKTANCRQQEHQRENERHNRGSGGPDSWMA